MCLGRSSSWKSASHCRRLPRVVFRKFVLDRNRTLDLGHPRIAGLSSAMRLVYPLTNWGYKEPPFLFVVAKLYYCNFGDTVCRSGDSAVRDICFGPEVCGSTPSPCKVLFCLPRPPRSLAPLAAPLARPFPPSAPLVPSRGSRKGGVEPADAEGSEGRKRASAPPSEPPISAPSRRHLEKNRTGLRPY